MENNDGMKEVYFDQFCPKCRHEKTKEEEQPCYDCLAEPANQYSHKPVRFHPEQK